MNLILAIEFYIAALHNRDEEKQLKGLRRLRDLLEAAIRGEITGEDYQKLMAEVAIRCCDPLDFFVEVLDDVRVSLDTHLEAKTPSLDVLLEAYKDAFGQ